MELIDADPMQSVSASLRGELSRNFIKSSSGVVCRQLVLGLDLLLLSSP